MRFNLLNSLVWSLGVWFALPAWAQDVEQTPAPNQMPQPLFISAHPSLFTVPDASRAFEKEMYPPEPFLPRDIYNPDALQGEIPQEEEPAIQLTQYPTISSAADDEDPEGHYTQPRWNPFPHLTEQLACLPKEERGFVLKQTIVTGTVIAPRVNDFSMSTLDVRTKFYFGKVPFIQFTPRFGWHTLGNRAGSGLPPQLFDAGLDTSIFLPLSQDWSFMGTVGPSIFTDGENTTSQAFRMTATALGFYRWSETTKIAVGFVYLDRFDLKAIPAAGLIYTPQENVKLELLFPRPKLSYRFQHEEGWDRWCYLAGEFGGGTWAIERNNGLNDEVTIRDYRLVGGIEHIAGDDFRCLFEAGFVFGRKIEYNSGWGDSSQSPTAMIRGGIAF